MSLREAAEGSRRRPEMGAERVLQEAADRDWPNPQRDDGSDEPGAGGHPSQARTPDGRASVLPSAKAVPTDRKIDLRPGIRTAANLLYIIHNMQTCPSISVRCGSCSSTVVHQFLHLNRFRPNVRLIHSSSLQNTTLSFWLAQWLNHANCRAATTTKRAQNALTRCAQPGIANWANLKRLSPSLLKQAQAEGRNIERPHMSFDMKATAHRFLLRRKEGAA